MDHVWNEREVVGLLRSLGLDPGERELTIRAILVELLFDILQRRPAPATIGELVLALERSHGTDGATGRVLLETVRRRAAREPGLTLVAAQSRGPWAR